MTTNIDRAAEIIDQAMGEVAMGYQSKPLEIAQALAAEGRLMPDLPVPYAQGVDEEVPFALFDVFDHPDGAAAVGGRVEITHTIVPDQRGYTPAQARAIALALIAAADYAERNPDGQ